MDETIIHRIRQPTATRWSLDNMRLTLAQLEKIGRIAYWNARLRSLLKQQLATTAGRVPAEV